MDGREDLPMISMPGSGTAARAAARPVVVRLPMRPPQMASKAFGKATTSRRSATLPSLKVPAAPAERTDPLDRVFEESLEAGRPTVVTRKAAAPAPAVEKLQQRLDEQRGMLQEALALNDRLSRERDELQAGAFLMQQEMQKMHGELESARQALKTRTAAPEGPLKAALEKLGVSEAARRKSDAIRMELQQRLAAAWAALQPAKPASAAAAASPPRPRVSLKDPRQAGK